MKTIDFHTNSNFDIGDSVIIHSYYCGVPAETKGFIIEIGETDAKVQTVGNHKYVIESIPINYLMHSNNGFYDE